MGINMKKLINGMKMENCIVEINDNIRKQIQDSLLEMYIDILEVCKRHGIIPYLAGGSCLGAIRHQGFIPWDDDFDIAMTRKDYNRFKKIFEKELGKKYILSAPNYKGAVKERFPKVFKKNTIYRGLLDDNSDSDYNGLFVDIFLMDNVPDNLLLRFVKGTISECLEFISGRVGMYKRTVPSVKKLLKQTSPFSYYINFGIGAIFSPFGCDYWFNLVDKAIQYKNNHTKYVSLATGRKHYFGEILSRNDLLPEVWVKYENYDVPVFKGYDLYLRNLYGDYLVVPPENKREHHYVRELNI